MEQFIITHIDGSTISLRQRNSVINVTRASQSVELLGNDTVDISLESVTKLYFQIGDKITIVGRDYTLNIPPKETKLSESKFRYDLQFEGVQYDLSRITYDINIDTTGSDLYADALTGNMKLFLDVLIANINRVFPTKWILGTYPDDTETKTLTFSETDNCLSVLQRLCEEYNHEFEIEIAQNGIRTINIRQAGKTIAFTFQYGKGKGIYELTREKVSSSNIVNRLKVYGGTKNISSKYRAARLCLPGKSKPQSFIEDAASITKYGVWENAKYFDDIYPRRIGIVTALGDTLLKFVDNTMDFDLNEKEADGVTTKYLLAGTPAKVHFNTGNLAGYEFETSYDHATKTFTIKSFKDERDMEFPSPTSAAFRFAAGDEYVLLDIAMPQSYIDVAEQKLLEKGQEYLSQNCQPKVQYSLTIEEFFLKKTFGTEAESNIFWVGDYIPIKDSDIEVDKLIRVKGFTRDLLNEYSYNLTISDLAVTRSIYNRIISDLIDIDKIIQINDLANVAKARRNWLNAQEVLGMVFDVEGDYYTDKIKPQSIETMMLSVGAKSMQFVLVGTVFQPNYGGNKNRIVYKGGTLTHYAIVDENNNPRYWVLQDGDVTVTNDFQAYYIYAKCEKNGTGGTMLFSAQQIQAEQDANYYHFLIGVLNSVDSELQVRSISLMYGFTTINGKFIRTGRIESSDGITYFDLDNSKIGGKIRFVSTEGEEQDLGEWADDTESSISQVDTAVTNLNTYVDGAFKDGVIQTSEAQAIEKYINIINAEKANLEQTYNVLYVNPYLSGTPKSDLLNAKVTYFGAVDTLINSINSAISDGKVTASEKTTVNNNYTSYNNALTTFSQKIEAANKAIQDTLKSYSDAAQTTADNAQAKAEEADYLKDALKQDTEVDGGLLLSSILATRDAVGVVRSYQSGDPDANPAAFAAGVEDFGTTSEKKKVEICHNGTGKIGIFVIDDSGNIKIFDPNDPTILRLMFSKNALPTLQSILDSNIYGGSVTNVGSIGKNETTILPNKLVVTESGATITFTGTLYVYGYLFGDRGRISITVRIVNESSLDSIYSITDGRILTPDNPEYTNTTNISVEIPNVDAGTYRIEISRILVNVDLYSEGGLSGKSTLSWSLNKEIKRFEFARNGFMAFYQNFHMYFSEDGGLDVRGTTNIPGVLLAGEAGYTGGFTSVWGAKGHSSKTAEKISTGQYRVWHSIGHQDYQVQITPTSANRTAYIYSKANDNFVVYFYSVGSSPALSDTGFHFSITGRNY